MVVTVGGLPGAGGRVITCDKSMIPGVVYVVYSDKGVIIGLVYVVDSDNM